MNAKEFIAQIVAHGGEHLSTEKVNTNNAWGFGGRCGLDYVFRQEGAGLFVLQTGHAYFRHLQKEKIQRVKVSGIYKAFMPKLFLELFLKGGLQAVHNYVKIN